jgi:hypothetical protein
MKKNQRDEMMVVYDNMKIIMYGLRPHTQDVKAVIFETAAQLGIR